MDGESLDTEVSEMTPSDPEDLHSSSALHGLATLFQLTSILGLGFLKCKTGLSMSCWRLLFGFVFSTLSSLFLPIT